MRFCFNCGANTQPDWTICRPCGTRLAQPSASELLAVCSHCFNHIASSWNYCPHCGSIGSDARVVGAVENAAAAGGDPAPPSTGNAPKVELISRGWDIVDVDPVADDTVEVPIPAGAVEVVVDDITVVTGPDAPEPDTAHPDRWDHLRPHAQHGPATVSTRLPIRIAQVLLALVAVSGIVAASFRFYLNTRVDALAAGEIGAQGLEGPEDAAALSLYVVPIAIVLTLLVVAAWFYRDRDLIPLPTGSSGRLAVGFAIAGIALAAGFHLLSPAAPSARIAANILVILGLGMIAGASVVAIRILHRATQ
jgi:RNA polymerase subunit RPABC4/transcription elongation factor Spt4